MRLTIVTLAALALVSCNKTEAPSDTNAADANMAADANVAAADANAALAASMAVDGKPDAGSYELTGPDGKMIRQTINADGTIINEIDGKVTKGTWTKTEPSTYCITLEGQSSATCYTDKMDGATWWSTNDSDPKDAYKVVRVG